MGERFDRKESLSLEIWQQEPQLRFCQRDDMSNESLSFKHFLTLIKSQNIIWSRVEVLKKRIQLTSIQSQTHIWAFPRSRRGTVWPPWLLSRGGDRGKLELTFCQYLTFWNIHPNSRWQCYRTENEKSWMLTSQKQNVSPRNKCKEYIYYVCYMCLCVCMYLALHNIRVSEKAVFIMPFI